MNLQNIKDKQADRPATRTCDTLQHTHFASTEPTWLETTYFHKFIHMQDVLCNVRMHYVIKVLILWS
jgi:hypothetical protein